MRRELKKQVRIIIAVQIKFKTAWHITTELENNTNINAYEPLGLMKAKIRYHKMQH